MGKMMMRCEGGRFKEPHEVRLGRRVVVLHDGVDFTDLPGGDSSNANVLLWVLTIQTMPEEEGGEMEAGSSTDDGTAEQAGCRAGGCGGGVGGGGMGSRGW